MLKMPSQKGNDMQDYEKKKFKGKKYIGHYKADDSSDSEEEENDSSLFILRAKKIVKSRNVGNQEVVIEESECENPEITSGDESSGSLSYFLKVTEHNIYIPVLGELSSRPTNKSTANDDQAAPSSSQGKVFDKFTAFGFGFPIS